MDITTIRRHLFSAVRVLGADEGTIEQRLRKVYLGNLRQISSRELPDRVRRDHEKLMADLSDLFEGQDRVDLERASLLARGVVTLYERVMDEQ